jgi:branched-subunit amino acid aminotransferase/4-amino-4-deoxychorismate lyase
MHYYLAEQDVRRRSPGARPLLLDEHGHVNETPTANVVGYRGLRRDGERFVAPLEHEVLDGVSQGALWSFLPSCPVTRRGWTPEQFLAEIDEAFVTSTPFCLLPVVRIDDAPILNGRPGPTYRRLLEAWSNDVGVDIAAQAKRFAKRI